MYLFLFSISFPCQFQLLFLFPFIMHSFSRLSYSLSSLSLFPSTVMYIHTYTCTQVLNKCIVHVLMYAYSVILAASRGNRKNGMSNILHYKSPWAMEHDNHHTHFPGRPIMRITPCAAAYYNSL